MLGTPVTRHSLYEVKNKIRSKHLSNGTEHVYLSNTLHFSFQFAQCGNCVLYIKLFSYMSHNMENMYETTSVDNSHYGNTVSVPMILKSLCQHTHTIQFFENRMEGMLMQK